MQGSYSVADNGLIAFTQTSPSHPAEVAVQTVKDKSPQRLTNLSADRHIIVDEDKSGDEAVEVIVPGKVCLP